MNISILSVFPSLYKDFLETSLLKRAQAEGHVSFTVAGFTDFCTPKERLDGPTAGHGAGMAIRPEVIGRAVEHFEQQHGVAYRIFLTPQGKRLDQDLVRDIARIIQEKKHLMVVAGRYEGIDARAQEKYVDLELSIGDYVLMGGDLPAMVLLEALLRYIPGVVGRSESVEKDSFSGPFVDFPTYTAPAVWDGKAIPEVLLSGNHAVIDAWRKKVAVEKSVKKHFEWVRSHCIQDEDRALAAQSIPPHYIVLMHDEVILEPGVTGTSSVTSLDIHDIARSAKTYGLEGYYLVTSLLDQQAIVRKILEFWETSGIEYNKQRHHAVSLVSLMGSLDQVMEAIERKEGKRPILVGTSARKCSGVRQITYKDQDVVWKEDRPVLFILGTAKGLAPQVMERCEYVLAPIEGFLKFNHLSVRSAAAVIFDRWLGINLVKLD